MPFDIIEDKHRLKAIEDGIVRSLKHEIRECNQGVVKRDWG